MTEIKTKDTFSNDEVWYRSSRALQTLGAAYALNLPVILATQHRFKLFFENADRNAMYSFPGAMEMGVIRGTDDVICTDLMKVLTILIISTCQDNGPSTPQKMRDTEIPNISDPNSKNPPTHLKPAKQTQSNTNSSSTFLTVGHIYGTRSKAKSAKFKTNMKDGESIYTNIWVLSEEELGALDLDTY